MSAEGRPGSAEGRPASALDEGSAPAIRVRQHVSPSEVAALVAALCGPEAGGSATGGIPARRTPPWLRAGLREGLGGRPAEQPSDLR